MKKVISILSLVAIVLSMSITALAGSIPEDLLMDQSQIFFAEVVYYHPDKEKPDIEFSPVKKIKGDVKLGTKQIAYNFNTIGDFDIKEGNVYLFTYFDENNPTDIFEVTSYDTSTLKLKNVEGDMWKRFEQYLNEGRYLAAEHERIDRLNNELVVENGETITLSELLGGYDDSESDVAFYYPDGIDTKVNQVERKKFFKVADDIICTEIKPTEHHNPGLDFWIVTETDKIGAAVSISYDGKVTESHPAQSFVGQPKYKISSADLGKLQQFMTDKTEKLPPLESPYARYIVYCVLLGVVVVFIVAFAIGFVVRKEGAHTMNFRKSRNLMWIGFAVGILIMALGIGFENEKVTVGFMAAGIIVFAIAAIQAFIFYVCPNCGYSLMNVRGAVPEHCPRCGKDLKWE